MSPSADVLALASAEFDVGAIAEGTTLTVKWRGKPVFIRHRYNKYYSHKNIPSNLPRQSPTEYDPTAPKPLSPIVTLYFSWRLWAIVKLQ